MIFHISAISTAVPASAMRRSAAALLMILGAAPAAAQSLADLASAEAARRAGVARPAKVYTNDDLVAKSAKPPDPAAEAEAAKHEAAIPAAAIVRPTAPLPCRRVVSEKPHAGAPDQTERRHRRRRR